MKNNFSACFSCPENEEWADCGSCERTCAIKTSACTDECKPAGCYCKLGYVRDKNKCIPQETCPSSTNLIV